MQTTIMPFTGRKTWFWDTFIIFMMASIVMALFLGSHALITPDEARYTEVAREMLSFHNYVTPMVNGVAFLDKPILFYWLQALSMKLFGVNEWAIRLWPALFGVLGVVGVYWAGRKLYDRTTGWLSALVLLTSPLYFGAAHYVNMDLEVAIWVSGALFSYLIAMTVATHRRRWLIAAYVFAGFAILTKGLLGLAFPMMIIGTWLLVQGRWRLLREMSIPLGFLIIALIVLPWFVLVQRANPDFLHYFFVVQQFSRFLTQQFNNVMPVWFYLPVILVGLLPWALFLPQAVMQQVRKIKRDEERGVSLFLLLWPLLIFIFFSIPSSKIVGYILPVMPPLALVIGYYLAQQWQQSDTTVFLATRKKVLGLAGLSLLLLISVTALMPRVSLPSIKPFLPTIAAQRTPQTKIVSYQHFYQDAPLYLQQRIILVANWDDPALQKADDWRRELLPGVEKNPASRQWMWNEAQFWQQWHRTPLLVFLPKSRLATFKEQAQSKVEILQQKDRIVLVSNAVGSG